MLNASVTSGKPRRPALLALLLATTLSSAAFAQSNEPGLVDKRFQEPTAPVTSPDDVQQDDGAGRSYNSNVSSKPFTLNSVAVQGATVYDDATLQSYFNDLLGQKVTLQDVQNVAAALTARYRADGYILSQAVVPQQKVKGGNVRIVVIEGSIENVSIEGDHFEASFRKLVENYGERIKASRPLKAKDLERYLLLVDDLPGITAKGLVRPIANAPGMANLVIVMKQKKFDFSLSTNNRGTRFLGMWQHQATAAANNLFGLYDRTLVRGVITSPVEELQFYDIQHEEQLGSNGTKIIVVGSYSRSNPGEELKVLDIDGQSYSFQATLSHPFIRSRGENLVGRVVANMRNTDTDILGTHITDDNLRVVRGGVSYDKADKWKGVNLVDAEISQGFTILGGSDEGIERSRANADGSFTKLNMDISRTQTLPKGFSIFAGASGQYAFQSLLAPEEFSIGSVGFGQAYDPSELTGDHGLAFKLELRWGNQVDKKYLQNYQLYGYYDIGAVWQEDQPGLDDRESLASTGLGIRSNFTPWLSGTAEVGFPLTRDVASEGDEDPRVFVGFTGRF